MLTACSTFRTDQRSPVVKIEGGVGGAPVGCDADLVAERLQSLLDALADRDEAVLLEHLPSEDSEVFQWLSWSLPTSSPQGDAAVVARKPADLSTLLADPSLPNGPLQLEYMTINGWDASRGVVHFGPIRIRREAEASATTGDSQMMIGKGAFHCDAAGFAVLSLAEGELPIATQ